MSRQQGPPAQCSAVDRPSIPAGRCPSSSTAGVGVGWTTVAALAVGPVPPCQEVALCPDPACDVVYFGADGLILRRRDVRVLPSAKQDGDALVCFCFLHRREELMQELRATGRSATFDAIRRRVRAGDCACEVRNPTGSCCLGEVRRIVDAFAAGPERRATGVAR